MKRLHSPKRWLAAGFVCAGLAVAPLLLRNATGAPESDGYLFNDSHFHLTNYVQKGTDIEEYLAIMGDRIGRSTLFGIPLQQTWSHEVTGEFAPTYYLQSDAPLYYYSFTDAFIANAYLSLTPEQRARLDPMITGFNPADMYGVEHIRRVLEIYPGVFSGIGEFTIHKEFVSSKVAGDVASLIDPALDRIFDFAGEVGLVVILHNDIDMPFAKQGKQPVYLEQMKELLRRHPETTIIWAHTGLGRVVRPQMEQATVSTSVRHEGHLEILMDMLEDRSLKHVHFDISWDEVAKYAVGTPEREERVAELFNKYPDRFLFGTDVVAPEDRSAQMEVFGLWKNIFERLTPEASRAIRKENYERLFDVARKKVRAWEKANVE